MHRGEQKHINIVKDSKSTNGRTQQYQISRPFGSMACLLTFIILFNGYIFWNLGLIKGLEPFDPWPHSALELFLSSFAILLLVAVLISQKRQARLEKIAEQVEFEVNLRAEKEITKVLEMLQEIQKELGIDQSDPEIEKMTKDLDTEKLHRKQKNAEKDS